MGDHARRKKTPNTIDESGDPIPDDLIVPGELVRPAIEAGNRFGIRYEELLAFIISAM